MLPPEFLLLIAVRDGTMLVLCDAMICLTVLLPISTNPLVTALYNTLALLLRCYSELYRAIAQLRETLDNLTTLVQFATLVYDAIALLCFAVAVRCTCVAELTRLRYCPIARDGDTLCTCCTPDGYAIQLRCFE